MGKKTGAEGVGDQETDDILKEMEDEGEALPNFGGDDSDEEEEKKPSKKEKEADEDGDGEEDEDDDSEGEEDDEDSVDEEEASDDEDDSEGDDDEEGEDDDEEDGDESQDEDKDSDESGKKKPVWQRLKDEKKRRRAAETLIDQLRRGKSEENVDQQIAKFAADRKMKPEDAKALVTLAAQLAAQQVGLDSKTRTLIASAAKSEEKRQFWDRQTKLFKEEFDRNVAPLAKSEGKSIKEMRQTLRELAFKPENAQKSLVDIYLGLKKPGRKITSETGRSNSRNTQVADLDDLSDINELSDEDFDKASESLASRSKSTITRRGGKAS